MKKVVSILLLVPILLLSVYGWGVYKNNRDIAMPDKEILQEHLNNSLQWLKNNKESVLNDRNSMLWWMLSEAAKTSKNTQLINLVNEFKQNNTGLKYSVWGPLLWPQQRNRIDDMSLFGLPDYNQHFVYSLHCANYLEDFFPILEAQNQAGFCFQASHIYRPACITHQLMGINFQQVQSCRSPQQLSPLIKNLQADIINQLTWDVRVVDVYLQRVMMLLITGAENKVKPVWVQQVIDHQLNDGGWGDIDPIISLGDKSIAYSSRIISIAAARSNLHATAQGIYLLSLLLYEKN